MKTLAERLLRLEPYIIALGLLLFWLTPEHLEFLALFVLPMLLRLIAYGRVWTATPLDILLLLLPVLIVLNYQHAPFTRSLWIGSRGIMGPLLVLNLADMIRRRGSTDRIIMITVTFGMVLGGIALVTSIWSDKSALLKPIIDLFPHINGLPGVGGGFNVNEIAGAMSWLMPFAAGIAIYDWREQQHPRRRTIATIAFFLLWLALFLGQSRMAIFGIIPALALLIFTLIPVGRWRIMALTALVLFSVVETVLFIGVFSPDTTLEDRDESSLSSRIKIWHSAIDMVIDHPLTGVGMNKYRLTQVRELYPVEGYEGRILPHTHNEWLQIATDLGVPGFLLFASWHIVGGYMLLQIWRRGDQAIAMSLLAGLIAHGVFGLADAIPLWDRFSFVFWWMVGLTAGQYLLTVKQEPAQSTDG